MVIPLEMNSLFTTYWSMFSPSGSGMKTHPMNLEEFLSTQIIKLVKSSLPSTDKNGRKLALTGTTRPSLNLQLLASTSFAESSSKIFRPESNQACGDGLRYGWNLKQVSGLLFSYQQSAVYGKRLESPNDSCSVMLVKYKTSIVGCNLGGRSKIFMGPTAL